MMPPGSGGIYVHVPFCVRKCNYCDFVSYPASRYAEAMGQSLASVTREFCLRESELERIRPIRTLYVGGGTPTCVPWRQLAEFIATLLAQIEQVNSLGSLDGRSSGAGLEVTVEANPGTVDQRSLAALKESGANRLSLGFQSLDAAELRALGRLHSPADCIQAYKWGRAAGFDNISVDLILGAPEQTRESLFKTFDILMSMRPEHISAYCLSVEEGTPLARALADGSQTVPDDDDVADSYEWLVEQVEAAGYARYEVSNFALPGFESAHNVGYWTSSYYVGLGVAAHSHLDGARHGAVRSWNVESVEDYMAAIEKGVRPLAGFEERNAFQEAQDSLMLGLRMSEGVDLVEMGRRFGLDLLTEYAGKFTDLAEAGLVEFLEGRVKLTPGGFLLGNLVFAECVECGTGAQP